MQIGESHEAVCRRHRAPERDAFYWDNELPGFGLRAFKSGKPGHDNDNFEPALREFMAELAIRYAGPAGAYRLA